MKLAMPGALGVPLMSPVDAFRVSPGGSVPLVTAQVMGVVPEAVSVCEYAVPTSPDVNGEVVVIEGAAFTVRLNCREALP